MPFNKQSAKAAGAKGGRAIKKLTLNKVETGLGPLQTIDDAQRWLTQLAVWAAANLMPSGSIAGSCVRAVEVWLRAHESKLTEEVVDHLKRDVEELKTKLKGPRRGA